MQHLTANPCTPSSQVVDEAGNVGTCVSQVSVVDVSAPAVTCGDTTKTLGPSGTSTLSAGDLGPAGTDNCDAPGVLSYSISDFGTLTGAGIDCESVGAHPVQVAATDTAGNVGVCGASVEVVDAVAPSSVTCTDVTVTLGPGGTATVAEADLVASVVDNCPMSTTLAFAEVATSANWDRTVGCSEASQAGSLEVRAVATDGSGNTKGCTVAVAVVDATPPAIVCDSVTLQLSAADGTVLAFDTGLHVDSVSDACQYTVARDASTSDLEATLGCANLGAAVGIEFSAIDQAGNKATCSSLTSVVDASPPTVSCLGAFEIELGPAGNGSFDAGDLVVAPPVNNCDANPALSVSDYGSLSLTTGTVSCAYAGGSHHRVVVTAVDAQGNAASCTVNVTVSDTTPPVLTCLDDYVVPISPLGEYVIEAAEVVVASSDACTPLLDDLVLTPGSQPFPSSGAGGVATVTIAGADAAGNQDSCEVLVSASTNPYQPSVGSIVRCDSHKACAVAWGSVSTPHCYNGSCLLVCISGVVFYFSCP